MSITVTDLAAVTKLQQAAAMILQASMLMREVRIQREAQIVDFYNAEIVPDLVTRGIATPDDLNSFLNKVELEGDTFLWSLKVRG
jgi:hypothetical protein